MIAQLHYRFRGRPTLAAVQAARAEFFKTGKAPRGVSMQLRVWKGDPARASKSGGLPGVVSEYASPCLTMCDYDQDRPPDLGPVWRLARRIDARPVLIRCDRTRRGWHLLVWWNRKFSPLAILAIQAILGSDPGREAFNLSRLLAGAGRSGARSRFARFARWWPIR